MDDQRPLDFTSIFVDSDSLEKVNVPVDDSLLPQIISWICRVCATKGLHTLTNAKTFAEHSEAKYQCFDCNGINIIERQFWPMLRWNKER